MSSITPLPGTIAALRKRPLGGPPPLPHSINRATILGLTISALAVVLILVSANDDIGEEIWIPELEFMESIASNRISWVTSVLEPVYNTSFDWAVPLLLWLPVAVLIATRRFRSALTYLGAFLVVVLLVSLLDDMILRPRPVGIEILGRWEGFAHPDRKIASITAVATSLALHSIPHGIARHFVKILMGAYVLLIGVAAVYLGVATPSAVGASIALGFSIPQLAFRWVTPPEVFPVQLRKGNTAHLVMSHERVQAIRTGIADQLGIPIASARAIALDGSAGSTPLLLETEPRADLTPTLFAKLYAQSHLRSDRLYKIGRTLLYGALEDEATFTSVRRLVEYEDYLATKIHQAGIRAARSLGVVELTPEREYVAVFEFLSGSRELGVVIDAGELDQTMIDDGIELVDQLWHAGLAHRDIKPSNVMVTPEGRLALIDVAFGQVRPTRWRQSVDLGNMVLLLTLGSSAEVVTRSALQRFTEDEIADALAAAHGVAVPTQLRNALKNHRGDVGGELRALVPPRRRVRLQRWSITRAQLAAGVIGGVLTSLILFATTIRLAGLLP